MKLKISVHGVAYEVDVEVLDAGDGFPAAPLPRRMRNGSAGISPPAGRNDPCTSVAERNGPCGNAAVRAPGPIPETKGRENSVTSPIAGTVMEIKCKAGDRVEPAQELILVEAMKMEASIAAPAAGTIRSVDVGVGDAIREGQIVVRFE